MRQPTATVDAILQRDLADVCYSAGTHKDHHSERLVVIADDAQQMTDRLQSWLESEEPVPGAIVGHGRDADEELVFVFTGQGSQWWAMGQQLLQREPLFRSTIEKTDTLFKELSGWSIVEEMMKSEDQSKLTGRPSLSPRSAPFRLRWSNYGNRGASLQPESSDTVWAKWPLPSARAYCRWRIRFASFITEADCRTRPQDTVACSPPGSLRVKLAK